LVEEVLKTKDKKEDTMINHILVLINYIEMWNSTGFHHCMNNIGL
jgi:hypothetical protein